MHAPYDREHGQAPHGGRPPGGAGDPRRPYQPSPHDGGDPYTDRDPLAQDPVSEALQDHAAQPPAPHYAPGPQYPGADDRTDRSSAGFPPDEAGDGRPDTEDAFAHLYRDQYHDPYRDRPRDDSGRHDDRHGAVGQKHPGQPRQQVPVPGAEQAPAAPPVPPADPASGPSAASRLPGRAAGLLRSSAIMAAGTLVSRVTGFIRQLVIVAALGAAVLGDTYTVAWALPSMIYILTIGGGLNSVFVPQLVRAMKNDADGGDAYANRLLTLIMACLGGLVAAAVLGAPLLIRMMSAKIADDPAANDVAVTFARYFLPTIFFMGVHVVLGQILNARDHFGPMMWTPVLNNIVVIFTFGTFLWVYGTQRSSGLGVASIPPEGVRLLGIGTLLGLVVQALAMIPYLRGAGFRIRPRFDWRGHGMGKAARLARWSVLFVLANQVGLIVVTQFATWAGENAESAGHPGTGFIAYNSALLIWQMPQAIITVSVMAALLPRISRSAADGDNAAVRDDLSHGLRTSAVAIVPIAFSFVALGVPMCTLLFGAAGESGARSFGYILMAFGLGLIPFSAQYVVLRAFYAYEDTRTPFYNTVIVSACWIVLSALSFVVLADRWVVAGIAFSYGIAYAVGVAVAWRRLRTRMSTDLDGTRVVRTYTRLCGASLPAALLGGGTGFALTRVLGEGMLGSLAALVAGGGVLLAVFYLAARRMRIEELTALLGMVRARLGR